MKLPIMINSKNGALYFDQFFILSFGSGGGQHQEHILAGKCQGLAPADHPDD